MRKLTQDQLEFFNENGYVIVPQVLSPTTLAEAQEAYWRMLKKCRAGLYSEVRVENQMSDHHVFGIERIFSPQIYEPAILKASVESGVLEFSEQLIQSEQTFILLNRLHCTNDFSYSGPWHRDGKLGQTDHIQSAISLYPEERFFVVPGTHKAVDVEEKEIEGQQWSRRTFTGQTRLTTSPGDLLLFHSSVLHRGSCVGRGKHHRAYIHYRIGKLDFTNDIQRMMPPEYATNPGIWGVDSRWDRLFERSLRAQVPHSGVIRRPPLQRDLRGLLKKSFYRLAYYGLSFLPEHHPLFTKKPNFTPYLRAGDEVAS